MLNLSIFFSSLISVAEYRSRENTKQGKRIDERSTGLIRERDLFNMHNLNTVENCLVLWFSLGIYIYIYIYIYD